MVPILFAILKSNGSFENTYLSLLPKKGVTILSMLFSAVAISVNMFVLYSGVGKLINESILWSVEYSLVILSNIGWVLSSLAVTIVLNSPSANSFALSNRVVPVVPSIIIEL